MKYFRLKLEPEKWRGSLSRSALRFGPLLEVFFAQFEVFLGGRFGRNLRFLILGDVGKLEFVVRRLKAKIRFMLLK